MATLALQTVAHAGAAVTFSAAAGGGDKTPTGVGVALLVKNGDSGSHTVTLAIPSTTTYDGLVIANRTVTVAAGVTSCIPLLDIYNDPADSLAHITYDAVTSVTVAVIRVA
jgi:hypothetical protein